MICAVGRGSSPTHTTRGPRSSWRLAGRSFPVRVCGDATRHEIQALRRENDELKQLVAVVGCQLLSLG